jgi:D-tyrosyl-tRNA(Tyr) deacylase
MIAVIQRVSHASVTVDSELISEITAGYLILLGVMKDDTAKDRESLASKIVNLRIMSDEKCHINRSILETKGEILVVSQFTLCADVTKGRRPSFIDSMPPEDANKMYIAFMDTLRESVPVVKGGKFGADMKVALENDGPVTIILDSTSLR